MDIATWLNELGLERYKQAFAENEIDAAVLPRLTADDLKDIGVVIVGHRRKLLEAIANLKSVSSGAPVSPTPQFVVTARHPVAERRQLTVMFVDLVGSTALSAQLDPEDMREIIRLYQNTVAGEIARFEGHVAKFMGDGVLCYFGWPKAHEDEAERAVRAGLALTQATGRLRTPAGDALQARIGIATGLVVVGDLVGEGAAQEQAVVGDTPNLAARLQGAAEPGTVIIAETTRRLLGDVFVLRDLGPQVFRGIQGPTPAFVVLGERVLESRFAARQGGSVAPIVGRDQELGLLLERWRQAKNREGQVVLLTGEAGIGKSRLTEALVESVAGEPHFLLRYQCSPYNADSALYPVIQQLSFAAGLSAEDSVERRLERLEALLAKGSDDVAETAQLLAALLNIDGTSRYGALTLAPQQRRDRTLAVLLDQLAGLAARKPVLWVIEDAHWIDPTTLELIESALDRVQGIGVLMLITARPTFVASFASHPAVMRMALNRLARAATQAIVFRITHGKRLPDILLDEVAARTDGVPLFVEEITKAVIESGALREETDAYHLDGPLNALAIPATLHDSLMARLDRLPRVKEVAQTASVIGRSFDHRTIAALADMTDQELAEGLRRLVEAELVFRRGIPPEASYLFKHALVRDAAYESLLRANRIVLHTRLLDALEDRGDTQAEVKAQHAEAAGLIERALDYWDQAGKLSLARPAYREAIGSFENAIRLCRQLGDAELWKRREQGLHLQLGQALVANLGYQAAAAAVAFERALILADQIGDPSLKLPALYGKWASAYVVCHESGEHARRFHAFSETLPETGPRLVGCRLLAVERFHDGRFNEALTLAGKSFDLYDHAIHHDLIRQFAHDPRTMAMAVKAWALWYLGWPDRAAHTIEESERWMRQVDHANAHALALCHGIVEINIWLRRPDRVEVVAREALRLAEDNSMALWRSWALIHLGWALSQLGLAPGIDEITEGLDAANRMGAIRKECFHRILAADAYARVGRFDDALECIAKGFATLAISSDWAYSTELHRMRAALVLHVDAGQRGLAEADLRRALEIAREQEALSLQLRVGRDLARLLAEHGDRQQAVDLLGQIYGRFDEGFGTPDLKEAKALLEELRT